MEILILGGTGAMGVKTRKNKKNSNRLIMRRKNG